MGKTARDLILELYKEDHITKQETDLLLDAISAKGNTLSMPISYKEYTKPDWTYNPSYTVGPWYTTMSTVGFSTIEGEESNNNTKTKIKKSLING